MNVDKKKNYQQEQDPHCVTLVSGQHNSATTFMYYCLSTVLGDKTPFG